MLHPHLVFSSSHGFIDSFPFLLNTKLERCHDHRIVFCFFLSPPVSHLCATLSRIKAEWAGFSPDLTGSTCSSVRCRGLPHTQNTGELVCSPCSLVVARMKCDSVQRCSVSCGLWRALILQTASGPAS